MPRRDTSFQVYALEQLGRVTTVTSRRMFGGVGIYHDALFFALMDDDTLYLKVDDANRPDFEARGLGPFRPFEDQDVVMQYYPVPEDVLETPDVLAGWVDKAVAVARRARRGSGRAKPKARATKRPRPGARR
ncbi:MAG: TfoX/Sxy family protein [Gemmatimonadales bacterium]|nr:TfoX/Sxy family protein [Gemmatimonadales bacterium]